MIEHYRCEYRYYRRYGNPEHVWILIGAKGAVHLHITDNSAIKKSQDGTGDIEFHYRRPPKHLADKPPSHDHCHILQCPCWHEGSSLQACELWIPRWTRLSNDHDAMFELLATRADEIFREESS